MGTAVESCLESSQIRADVTLATNTSHIIISLNLAKEIKTPRKCCKKFETARHAIWQKICKEISSTGPFATPCKAAMF